MDNKDSLFYKTKAKKQYQTYQQILTELPAYVAQCLAEKEFTTEYSSLIAYARDYIVFFHYLSASNPALRKFSPKEITAEHLAALTEDDIIEFQRYLRFGSLNSNSSLTDVSNDNRAIARKMTSLRTLFKFLVRKEYIEKDIVSFIPMPKISDRNVLPRLSADPDRNEISVFLSGVESILNNTTISSHQRAYLNKSYLRDNALLHILLGTGIRVSECQGLDLNDVDMQKQSLRIKRKGGFYDEVYFNQNTLTALLPYFESRILDKEEKGIEEPALFLSAIQKRISVDAIENVVGKYTTIILNKHMTCHALRRSFGTALYERTGDIKLVSDTLGHKNITTTSKFYVAQSDKYKQQVKDINIGESSGDSSAIINEFD